MVNKAPLNAESGDSLDDLLGTPLATVIPNPAYGNAGQPWPNDPRDDTAATLARIRETVATVAAPLHRERCAKCRGSGRFTSYAGRDCGPCFTCKGLGYKEFKTSTESRIKAKESRTARAANNAAENWNAFSVAHADLAACILANPSFDYLVSMRAAVEKYGALTERQEIGVRKCIAANERRRIAAESSRAAYVAKVESAPVIDAGKLESALATARGNGLKNPKLRVAQFLIKYAPATGRNAGSLYVLHRETRAYLGKVTAGRFISARDCTSEMESAFLTVCNDPAAAAIAYGQRTGTCACCGAELTNAESIARGIGPICAENFGW